MCKKDSNLHFTEVKLEMIVRLLLLTRGVNFGKKKKYFKPMNCETFETAYLPIMLKRDIDFSL